MTIHKSSYIELSVIIAVFSMPAIAIDKSFIEYTKQASSHSYFSINDSESFCYRPQVNYANEPRQQSVSFNKDLNNTNKTYDFAEVALVDWRSANHADGVLSFDYKDCDRHEYLDLGSYGKGRGGWTSANQSYVTEVTDLFENWGNYGSAVSDVHNRGELQYSYETENVLLSLGYQSSSDNYYVDGAVDVNEQYTREASFNHDIRSQVKATYGISMVMGFSSNYLMSVPLSMRLGYEKINLGLADNVSALGAHRSSNGYEHYISNHLSDDSDMYAYSASLSLGSSYSGLYFATDFSARNIDLKDGAVSVDGIEAVVGYGFSNGLYLAIGYQYKKYNFKHTPSNHKDAVSETVPFQVSYSFNDKLKVWGEARIDAGSDSESNKLNGAQDNIYSAGARYTF
ncbi:MAG: porin [Succinivibrio sp.]|nr:porin [Succinivibrio sp.]